MSHSHRRDTKARSSRKDIADDTLAAIDAGFYELHDTRHDLNASTDAACKGTRYYAPNSSLSNWKTPLSTSDPQHTTQISLLEMTTLKGAQYLYSVDPHPGKIAVLNFASAKKPGGGFLSGASAQEESIARSSNLYSSLMTDTGQAFYRFHKRDPKEGFYSHAMIYTPGVSLFRDDDGTWLPPIQVDIVTSAAVNAGTLRDHSNGERVLGFHKDTGKLGPVPKSAKDLAALETQIEDAMRERMARVLFLCENAGANALVLGSFGTGVFRNKVDMVARLWADLLTVPGARFQNSFEKVVFAIMDKRTLDPFEAAFAERTANGSIVPT
ncbi:hypothetical protein CYLTODRAFT_423972 [Cylindrobasidium torrendii FP15055 ss-10]|uniref:Microbial-type PARG catalytic domain-containing protein n=1 Tax=Cylindrobasidium torrendii FP15055 ss-10 TaxID=1314674 RepID=A0A0D7B6M4_9AGAR|nr:hypothetical protein CYLTODRAFT_423972 [Cylindrobasidium torrendii FP15055 ss-10]